MRVHETREGAHESGGAMPGGGDSGGVREGGGGSLWSSHCQQA